MLTTQSPSKRFDRHLNTSRLFAYGGRGCSTGEDHSGEIVRMLEEHGLGVLVTDPAEGPADVLRALGATLGEVWRHERADATGVASIAPTHDSPGYLGTSNAAHPPHTDGAYRRDPPNALALYCSVPSRTGGESIAVSCGTLYDALTNACTPEETEALFALDAVTIARRGAVAAAPVFTRAGNTIRTRFRMDTSASVKPTAAAEPAYAKLTELAVDPELQVVFRLEPGHVLVVDNTAILHGRRPFPPGEWRELHRMNYQGSDRVQFGFVPLA